MTIAFLIVLTLTVQGQVEQYRSYKVVFFEDWNSSTKKWETMEDYNVSFLITWNIKDQILTIHGDTPIKIYITGVRGISEMKKDEDGDEYKVLRWYAVDADGEEVYLMSKDWLKFDNRNWTLTYDGFSTEFFCKII